MEEKKRRPRPQEVTDGTAEQRPKKKRPRPQEGTEVAKRTVEQRPKKKRPRPEGSAEVTEKTVEQRPKKKRPRPEGSTEVAERTAEQRPKKKRPRPEEGTVASERTAEQRPKKKRPRPEGSAEVAEEKTEQKPKKKRAEVQEAYAEVLEDDVKPGQKKKGKKKGGILSTIILLIAIAVFCFSAFQLYLIFSGYKEGQDEYKEVIALAIEGNNEEEFKVNFDELMNINQDTVGWIRFYPEPAQINYPVVQGPDNDLYLSKTFSANDNTVGAIFVNVYNNPDFNDRHTIVYGHRMNDNTMFHDLAKYRDKDFWESNPYFYIYTPDGRKITYQIYAAGEILETSDSYLTEFANDEEYQNFLYLTEQESGYATGVDVTIEDTVVTLSTCVKGKDEARFVVRGVKALEETIEETAE